MMMTEKKTNTTRSYVKHTIKRMCAQDKRLIKKTFHEITTFTTRLTSSGMGLDMTMTPQAPRGIDVPARRMYGGSRRRSTAATATVGVGAEGLPGPSTLATPLPLPASDSP